MAKQRKSNQETLGGVIDRMLDIYKLRSGLTELSIQSDWAKIAGPVIAERTDEILLKGSKLIIRLNSAALRQRGAFTVATFAEILLTAIWV